MEFINEDTFNEDEDFSIDDSDFSDDAEFSDDEDVDVFGSEANTPFTDTTSNGGFSPVNGTDGNPFADNNEESFSSGANLSDDNADFQETFSEDFNANSDLNNNVQETEYSDNNDNNSDEDEVISIDELEFSDDIQENENDSSDDAVLDEGMSNAEEVANGKDFVSAEDRLANNLAFSCPVSISVKKIPVDQLIVSHFKKKSRETTIIGLTSIIEKWGIVQPLSVLKLVDDNQYLVLDGLRRLFAAIKTGAKEVECRVWDFEDKTVGKKMANVLSLMITRSERYTAQEQWNMMQILEDVNDLDPGMIEYLCQMESGEAMKLKDIMTCNDFYSEEIQEKLLTGEYTIEAAYKKLANLRKKENKLAKEDDTSVDIEGISASESPVGGSAGDISVNNEGSPDEEQHFTNDEVAEMLELAHTGIESNEPLESLNKTNEIRGSDMHQKVGERHPVDPAVRQGTFIRDGFKCRCCGLGGNEAYLSVLAFHHAVPVYLGGPDTKENGLTLCVTCHILLHNYLFGQLQVELDKLDEHEQERFRNVFKYGNIALEAQKRRGVSKEEARKQDDGLKHPKPNANININRQILKDAEAQGYSLEDNHLNDDTLLDEPDNGDIDVNNESDNEAAFNETNDEAAFNEIDNEVAFNDINSEDVGVTNEV